MKPISATIATIGLVVVTLTISTANPRLATAREFDPDEIAKLPQDAVTAIKQDCTKDWGTDYRMRLYCENKQYEALRKLIERGSIR